MRRQIRPAGQSGPARGRTGTGRASPTGSAVAGPAARDGGRGRVGGYAVGHWLGNLIASGYTNIQGNGQNDVAIVLGLSFGVLGWLAGIGALNYPLAKLVGREPLPEVPAAGLDALLPVHDRPQGRRHAVPVRGAHLPLHRRACWPWPSAPSC